MKKRLAEYPIAVIGLGTALITGVLAVVLGSSGVHALVLVFLPLILGLCVEILHRVRVLKIFSILSTDGLGYLLSDGDAQRFVQTYLASSQRVCVLRHPLLTAGTQAWTAGVQSRLEEHAEGILSGEVRGEHGPPFLREPELLRSVKDRLLATSLVNVGDYWKGGFGTNYLEWQRELVERLRPGWEPEAASFEDLRKSPITRIFIYPRDRLPELRDVLKIHKDYRLYARVAILEEVPENLRDHDFMIIDDVIMERLDLVEGKPRRATFYFRGTTNADASAKVNAKIEEGLRLFKSLGEYAREPEKISEIGLS